MASFADKYPNAKLFVSPWSHELTRSNNFTLAWDLPSGRFQISQKENKLHLSACEILDLVEFTSDVLEFYNSKHPAFALHGDGTIANDKVAFRIILPEGSEHQTIKLQIEVKGEGTVLLNEDEIMLLKRSECNIRKVSVETNQVPLKKNIIVKAEKLPVETDIELPTAEEHCGHVGPHQKKIQKQNENAMPVQGKKKRRKLVPRFDEEGIRIKRIYTKTHARWFGKLPLLSTSIQVPINCYQQRE